MSAAVINLEEWRHRIKAELDKESYDDVWGKLLPILAAQCERCKDNPIPCDVEQD